MKYLHVKSLLFFVLLLSTFLISCQKEKPLTPEEITALANNRFPGVHQELWIYFQKFEEEAIERGVEIDLVAEGITGFIVDIEERGVAGQCNYNSRRPNHVIVDKQFWDNSSTSFREFIVFHELGHCSLFRDHLETATGRANVCTSIMRSGTGDCRDNYHGGTREAYLDELFLAENVPFVFDVN